MINTLKQIRRGFYTLFKLRPMHKVMAQLKQLNYKKFNNGLEVFAYRGWYHTIHYKNKVKNLEVWEIAEDCKIHLQKNLPNAKIIIGDSYKLIKETHKKYDLIVIDNHQGLFGNGYCEHFEIIDDCFNTLNTNAVLIFNIIPTLDKDLKIKHPEQYLLHKTRRNKFYTVLDSENISLDYFKIFYLNKAQQHQFKVKHIFFQKRNYVLSYCILCLEKTKH